MSYAKSTTVSEENSRAEIERTIRKHVGRDASFTYGSMRGKAAIQFSAHGRQVRFELPLPSAEEAAAKIRALATHNTVTPSRVDAWLDQEHRRRWRCMLLIVKAKFEAVALKLELAETEEERSQIFEQEFLACLVVGNGQQTIYQAIREAKLGGQRLLPSVEDGHDQP
jgi:hypothetical protein